MKILVGLALAAIVGIASALYNDLLNMATVKEQMANLVEKQTQHDGKAAHGDVLLALQSLKQQLEHVQQRQLAIQQSTQELHRLWNARALQEAKAEEDY